MSNINKERTYTKTGYCHEWGSEKHARRVAGLTSAERAAIRAGKEIFLADCPAHGGETDRRIVAISGRFYCRMP